jgi:light-regulated signal transduction histidine kinase (bacteriophytochrome)
MAPDERFPRVVSLACHDLRTPLATVYGFARTLTRAGELDDRAQRFVGMIEEAAEQMTVLLDQLGTAARIQADRWEPALREADTLALARSDDDRVDAHGEGATVTTEPTVVSAALESLAVAASRFGPVERVAWEVHARVLELSPVTAEAAPVVTAEDLRDLGAIVARYSIEQLGGSVELADDRLRVTL